MAERDVKDKSTTVRISKDGRDTLRRLSELSGIEIKTILEEWTSAIDKKMESIDCNRLIILSTLSNGNVTTFINGLDVGLIQNYAQKTSEPKDAVVFVCAKHNEPYATCPCEKPIRIQGTKTEEGKIKLKGVLRENEQEN